MHARALALVVVERSQVELGLLVVVVLSAPHRRASASTWTRHSCLARSSTDSARRST
jgi:hypothetical protein